MLQPILESQYICIRPLESIDFEVLYAVASDPEIWEQHPSKDRWQKAVFQRFFDTAMQSNGAFKILDTKTNEVIGSTRFYEYEPELSIISIYARRYWGTGTNGIVKKLMLDYIFQFVSIVRFHIGAENIRSQVAIQRLGASKISEVEVCYQGETKSNLNYIFQLTRDSWRYDTLD